MANKAASNRQWVLNQRPIGEPDRNTLRLVASEVPSPGTCEMLLRNEYLSLDPYMRGRMSAANPMPSRWPLVR